MAESSSPALERELGTVEKASLCSDLLRIVGGPIRAMNMRFRGNPTKVEEFFNYLHSKYGVVRPSIESWDSENYAYEIRTFCTALRDLL